MSDKDVTPNANQSSRPTDPTTALDEIIQQTKTERNKRQERMRMLKANRDDYLERSRQFHAAMTAVYDFPNQERKQGEKPTLAIFRRWAERFKKLGTILAAVDPQGHAQAKLNEASKANVPALALAASLILAAKSGESNDALAQRLQEIHDDAELRKCFLWLPYIADNLFLPEPDAHGLIAVASVPDGTTSEEREKADRAFGYAEISEEISPEWPEWPEDSNDVSLEPKELLTTWKEIARAVNFKDKQYTKIKTLNERLHGPIVLPTKGSQPIVEKKKLIEWWNSLEILQADLANQRSGAKLSARVQHNYGRTGVVSPEIAGSIKERRKKR